MVDQKIIEFISKLGIGEESAKIYLALIMKSRQTAQTLAKKTGIPKTTIYRRLEELKKFEIVEEQVDEYKKFFTAASTDLLNLLVIKKEQEVKELRAELPEITELLVGQTKNFDPGTKVLFYRGKDGIQQMNWNALKTKGELCGYTYRAWDEVVGVAFIEKFLDDYSRLTFNIKELYSDELIKSRDYHDRPNTHWPRWEGRYLSPEILDINHQMDIYNDVVAIYNWHEGDVFGVEIYNEKVAKMQRQIFDLLWQQGENLTQKERENMQGKIT